MADIVNDYSFWTRRLAGEVPSITEDPEPGFYRVRARDGVWYPCAYWYGKDGALRCRISTRDVDHQTAMERWPYASKAPITHEEYKAVMAGAAWSDQHEAVNRDRANSDAAPDENSFDALEDRIKDLAREAEKLIAGGAATDQPAANRASDLANRLGELHGKADFARKAEKRPHDEKAAEVQKKWMPLIDSAEIYKRIKTAVITPFLVAEQQRQDAVAEAARAEAQANGTQPATVAQRAAPKAGSGGRRSVALRDYTVVTITDRDALLSYFKDRQEITEILQQMAELAVKAKVTPPGVNIGKEQRAA